MKTQLHIRAFLVPTLFLFFITLNTYSQDETVFKEIKGSISYLNTPIPNVNISIRGTSQGTESDTDGSYSIKAKVGDILEYTHVSFKKIIIVIEDVTSTLNIEMTEKPNELDAAVVIAKKKVNRTKEFEEKMDVDLKTPFGNFNPKKSGFSIGYIDGDRINPGAPTIEDALNGKLAGISKKGDILYVRGMPATYIVDGFQMDNLIVSTVNIEDIYVVKRQGLIIINTKNSIITKKRNLKKITEQNYNQNFYADDALSLDLNELNSNSYTEDLKKLNSKEEAIQYYSKIKPQISDYSEHIDIAQTFFSFYDDKKTATNILNETALAYPKNPEILKAIAFNLQSIDETREAVDVLKNVAKLRPNYAQSHRDLANAYKENNEFKMAWRIYMNYMKNRDVDKAGAIDQIIYNEMEYLHFSRQHQTKIKEQFIPNNESKEKFINDIRFVIEWNTSEAEFDLEFVGPDKRAFAFEHTQNANQDLIIEEKLNGFTSEEFFINDIGIGEWLVNLSYYGNKKSAPTYFKVTTYYHWGKPQQQQEIVVYKLLNTEQKLQLKKVNEESLITSK